MKFDKHDIQINICNQYDDNLNVRIKWDIIAIGKPRHKPKARIKDYGRRIICALTCDELRSAGRHKHSTLNAITATITAATIRRL